MAMTWRPPKDIEARLDAAAFVTGETKSDLVTEAVRKMLDNHPKAAEIRRALPLAARTVPKTTRSTQ